MEIFLASNIGGIKKENGQKFPVKFFENNKFLDNLKLSIKNNNKFVMIASNPEAYEVNDKFLQMDIEALNLSGMKFDKYLVLDNRSKDKVSEILEDSNLIFLAGGKTIIQNTFFNSINLKEELMKLNCTIVGISAGAINLSTNVYNVPEDLEDENNPLYLSGLGLTNINVIPHFNLYDLDTDEKKMQRESVLSESSNRTLLALPDKSYVYIKEDKPKLFGETYIIKNGKIDKICNNDESIDLEL